MWSRNSSQTLSPDISPDPSSPGASDGPQPGPDLDRQYLQYQDWVPFSERKQDSLELHNQEVIGRWNRALRNNLCATCAKFDSSSLRRRQRPKQFDWDSFKVTDDAVYTDAWSYSGLTPKRWTLNISQGKPLTPVSGTPKRPGCRLCGILCNLCCDISPGNCQFTANFRVRDPEFMCSYDCDKDDVLSTIDIQVEIGSIERILTIVPLLHTSGMEQPTKHKCMLRQGLRPFADFRRLAGWIEHCDRKHQHEEPTNISERLLPHVRFIDVKKKCIVERSLDCSHAALSYVWGKRQQFQLNRKRLKYLQEPQSLLKVWGHLSRVVTDAIAACEHLHIPFLWIDTLCIVEDDPDEKHSQIENMDQIYSFAYITLVAAAGTDAYAGLPRVSEGYPRNIQTFRLDDSNYQIADTSDWDYSELNKSAWCTRGWTFQELVLSNRVLIFTPTEVLFYCSKEFKAEYRHRLDESTQMVESGASVLRMCNCIKLQLPSSAVTYAIYPVRRNYATVHWDLLNNYLRRQLSYDTDILAAFSGVLSAEGTTIGTFHWGLPCNILVRALFWDLNNLSQGLQDHRSYGFSEFSMIPRNGFPSWSWTGWKILKTEAPEFGKQRHFLMNRIDAEDFSPLVHIYSIESGEARSLIGEESYTEGIEGFSPGIIEHFNLQMRDYKQQLQLDTRAIPNLSRNQKLCLPPYCLIFLASCSTFIVSSRPERSAQDPDIGLYKIEAEEDNGSGRTGCPGVWLSIKWRERQGRALDFVLLGKEYGSAAAGNGGAYRAMLIKYKDGIAQRVAIPQSFTLDQWLYGQTTMQWITLA